MRARAVAILLLVACLASASRASAYFVIELHDGAEIRADFVREEAGVVYAARDAGELAIEKPRIRSIREVDPGTKVGVAKPVVSGLATSAPAAPPVAPTAPNADPAERERQVVRKIIFGQRDLLFAMLRGESPEEIAKRERELKALKSERTELQKERAPSRR